MKHAVIRRDELLNATLQLGGTTLSLADYATTGVRAIAIGPSGSGKTSLGLLMAEQLSEQGWVAVLVDPEGEIASLYGDPVESPRRSPHCCARERNRSWSCPYATPMSSCRMAARSLKPQIAIASPSSSSSMKGNSLAVRADERMVSVKPAT